MEGCTVSGDNCVQHGTPECGALTTKMPAKNSPSTPSSYDGSCSNSSPPRAPRRVRLTDLPLQILARILQIFTEDITHPRHRLLYFACRRARTNTLISSSGLSKAHRHRTTPLPLSLLPILQTSRKLATALAIALQSHGRRSSMFSVQLCPSAWLTCLAPVLERFDAGLGVEDGCEGGPVVDPLLVLHIFARASFPCLRYLDLSEAPVYTTEHLAKKLGKKLSDLTEDMLVNVGETLHTLVLPAHGAFVTALAKAKMPLLRSVTIIEIESPNERVCATRVGQMLQGLAEVIVPKALTELHLKRMEGAPTFSSGSYEELSSLLRCVTVLTLEHRWIRYGEERDIATLYFLSLFPNLKRLDWNGDSYVSRIRDISISCPSLEELFLNPGHEFMDFSYRTGCQDGTTVYSDSIRSVVSVGPYRGSSSSIDELTTVCDIIGRDKVRVSRKYAVATDVQRLLCNIVPLRQVTLAVTNSDIGILRGLCMANSDTLERLRIIHTEQDLNRNDGHCKMNDEGWCIISSAVGCARSLSELRISGNTASSQDSIARYVDACLISMGGRALEFEVSCRVFWNCDRRLGPIIRAHTSLLQTVRANNPRLRRLSVCTEHRTETMWYRDMMQDDVRELLKKYLSELAQTGNALPELVDAGWSAVMAHKYIRLLKVEQST